jgi:hypothetical protein
VPGTPPYGTTEDFYAWWEPTNEWVNFKNTTVAPVWSTANVLGAVNGEGSFIPGKGYLVEYAATGTKQFTGTLNKDDISVSGLGISTGPGIYYGSHLLGNPYPSALVWNNGNWALNNIVGTAKVWNETNASYTDIAPNGIIPALNGFMVQVSSGTGSLTIPASARVHNGTAWYKSSGEPYVMLVAGDAEGHTAQESVIRFHSEATAGFDPAFDAWFRPGHAPHFYSVAGSDQLSTIALPGAGGSVQIPFHFVKNNASQFTITAGTISGIHGPVLLKDLKTNSVQDLAENPVYSFTSVAGDEPGRFLVTFSHVGLDEPGVKQPFSVYAAGSDLMVRCKTGTMPAGELFVYNMMGQTVARQQLGSSNPAKISLAVPSGFYLVKVVAGENIATVKVFINR